jgi:O-antigen/teichoic acid export membrane protein
MRLLASGPARALIRNGGTYLGFTILNKIIPFFLLPLMTTFIDPDGYGKISMFSIIMSLSMVLIGFCSNTVITQKYYKVTDLERRDLITASYCIMFVTYLALSFLVLVIGKFLSSALKLEVLWIELALLSGFMGIVFTMRTTVFQLKKEAWNYGVSQGASALLNVLLSLYFVIGLGYAWQGRLISITLVAVAMALMSLYYSLKAGEIEVDRTPAKQSFQTIIKLGGSLIPGGISGWVFAMSDRLFLNKMISLEAVGIYSVGITIAQITDFTFNSVGQAYLPFFYERVHSQQHSTRVKVVRATYLIMAGYVLFALFMVFFCPLMLKVMTNVRFHQAAGIVGIMSCSYALMAMGSLFYNYVISAERNVLTTYISYLTLASNIVANYFLIKAYGITGAAMASVVSSTTFMLSNMAMAARYCKMPWYDKEVFSWN